MVRPGHFFYDTRKLLGSSKILVGFLVVAGLVVMFVSFQFIYLFALLFAGILAVRGLIGRRCPVCDMALKETEAEPDKTDAFTLYINWTCPRDGYMEREKTKGDAGLFGVN